MVRSSLTLSWNEGFHRAWTGLALEKMVASRLFSFVKLVISSVALFQENLTSQGAPHVEEPLRHETEAPEYFRETQGHPPHRRQHGEDQGPGEGCEEVLKPH